MHRLSVVLAIVGLAMLVSCSADATESPGEQGSALMEKIRSAWQARQDKIHSAHVAWSGDFVLPKGASSLYNKDAPVLKQVKTANGFDPPRDYSGPTQGSLLYCKGKLAFQFKSIRWDTLKQQPYSFEYQETLTGESCKTLTTPASPVEDYPVAQFGPVQLSQGLKQVQHHAILVHLFGLDPRFSSRFLLDRWEPTLRTTTLRGRPCVELQLPSSNKKQTQLLYLDSERDYVLVRQVVLVKDKPTWIISADYKPHPEIGWMVDTLEHSVRPNGSDPYESARLTVTRCDLNVEPASSAFEMKLPPRTLVVDVTTGQEWQSVVDEQGRAREPLLASNKVTLEHLHQQPLVQAGWSRFFWVGIAGSVFAISVAGLIYVRRRRQPA